MNNLDALARVVLRYIQEHDGQTILIKNIATDTAINPKTISKKIKILAETGYIIRDGKKFTVTKKEAEHGAQK